MSNVQKNENPSTASARKMTGIIDVHSHIITNIGSQAPMEKLPPWSSNRIGPAMPGVTTAGTRSCPQTNQLRPSGT